MEYCKELIAGKLRRWERYLAEYRLPAWDDIPEMGLYMEQVIQYLKKHLDYLPPELKEEQFITAATINNYVRKKVMPEPVKKKYYRLHLAYLIMICTLKHSLSIPTLQTVIPADLSEEEMRKTYESYVARQQVTSRYFIEQVRVGAAKILDMEADALAAGDTEELITSMAIVSGLSRLLAEKLLLLEGKDLSNGGSIEPRSPGAE